MEVFYSNKMENGKAVLSEEESRHCVKVLRHKVGDKVFLSGGDGNLYECVVEDDNPRAAVLSIVSVVENPAPKGYFLCMAVAPTKNIDRFEWFVEKTVEIGVDRIVPLRCAHSERRVFNVERGRRIVVSAAKQSLKGSVPQLDEMTDFQKFMQESESFRGQKFIAYCDEYIASGKEDTRLSLRNAVSAVAEEKPEFQLGGGISEVAGMNGDTPEKRGVMFLIGPEGDFSSEEIQMALQCGFKPLSLGPSRLRTETAALLCVTALYVSESCH